MKLAVVVENSNSLVPPNALKLRHSNILRLWDPFGRGEIRWVRIDSGVVPRFDQTIACC